MDNDSKTEISEAVTISAAKASGVSRKKNVSDHVSKYSGSRKSSVDTTNTGLAKNVPRIENTYKMSPDENKRFYAYKIYSNILELVTEKMNNCEKLNPACYNTKAAANLTRDLADNIRREAKNLSVPRYKIVVHVVIGQNNGQDGRVASRCLWNTDYDNCVSIQYKSKFMWASAVIFVLYAE